MKKIGIIFFSFLLLFSVVLPNIVSGIELNLGKKNMIWNREENRALNVSWMEGNSIPIREGMYDIIHNPTGDPSSVGGVIDYNNTEIGTHKTALDATMALIQIVINYALAILAFIALVYLIYHGFLMVTASGDDKQFDKGKAGIKTASVALIGIGLSWLVVSLILWFITQLTD